MEDLVKIKENAIRRQWDEKSGKWYFSIIDTVGIMAKSTDARNYWKVLKSRLKKAQNQLVTQCNQLKMMASDGKFYLTDVADEKTMLGIIKLVSPDHFLQFKRWFDQLPSGPQRSPLQTTEPEVFKENSYPQKDLPDEDLMLMVDGYKEGDTLVIQAFVAGVDIENIFISVTCKTVIIEGERPDRSQGSSILINQNRDEKNTNEKNYSEQELSWGKFSRAVTLPEEIEIDGVQASEQHGLLTIKLPIINKDRSKIIKIKSL